LHYRTRRTSTKSRCKRKPNKALSSTQPNLHAFTIGHHTQDGSQTVIHEKGKLDGLASLVQHRVDWQRNEFQFREECGAPIIVRKSEQDFVVKGLPIDATDGSLGRFFFPRQERIYGPLALPLRKIVRFRKELP
jgi:hypothetical protein